MSLSKSRTGYRFNASSDALGGRGVSRFAVEVLAMMAMMLDRRRRMVWFVVLSEGGTEMRGGISEMEVFGR